jgi:hypothetical protein
MSYNLLADELVSGLRGCTHACGDMASFLPDDGAAAGLQTSNVY